MAGRPPKAVEQKTFGGAMAAAIRARRVKRGLSVDEACARAKITTAAWYDWESGRNAVPMRTLPAIARALGCKPKALIPEI